MYLMSLNLPRVDRVGDGLNGMANPGPTTGPAVATAPGAAGGSGAPAPVTGMLGVIVGGPAGIGPSNPAATRTTPASSETTIGNRSSAGTKSTSDHGDGLERLHRLPANEQDAVAALLELWPSAAGPSTATPGAAPVGRDDDDGEDDDEDNEEEIDSSTDEQPLTKRRRVADDREDGREEVDDGEQSKSQAKGKERAADW